MRRLCVFCGSSLGSRERYAECARRVGGLLVQHRIGLVYGGGHVGLMGTLADAVLQGGGEVIGVIPQALLDKELAHRDLTQLRVVATMHQRKAEMADLSDGFAALPGGCGTMDELFEILTWAQLGLHRKPIGLLNVDGFFDPLLAWLDHSIREGFIKEKHRALLLTANEPEHLLEMVLNYRYVEPSAKWIRGEDR